MGACCYTEPMNYTVKYVRPTKETKALIKELAEKMRPALESLAKK